MVGGELKCGNREARLRVFWATVKTLVFGFCLSEWEPWEGCEQRKDVPDSGFNRILLSTMRTDCGDQGGSRELLWGLRKVCSDYSAPPQPYPSAVILSNHCPLLVSSQREKSTEGKPSQKNGALVS